MAWSMQRHRPRLLSILFKVGHMHLTLTHLRKHIHTCKRMNGIIWVFVALPHCNSPQIVTHLNSPHHEQHFTFRLFGYLHILIGVCVWAWPYIHISNWFTWTWQCNCPSNNYMHIHTHIYVKRVSLCALLSICNLHLRVCNNLTSIRRAYTFSCWPPPFRRNML